MNYIDFLKSKIAVAEPSGFEPGAVNPVLKPHQADAVRWACRGGRRALFESFGRLVGVFDLGRIDMAYLTEMQPCKN